MELGLTWPLQRFLKEKPFLGMQQPDPFCWDLHRIILRGRDCLLLVHSLTRFTCLRYDVTWLEWENLFDIVREEIALGFAEAGIPEQVQAAYFQAAGALSFTRTHGRRPVAYLNRAWEDVLKAEPLLIPEPGHQGLLCRMVNGMTTRAAAYSVPGHPIVFLQDCLGAAWKGEA